MNTKHGRLSSMDDNDLLTLKEVMRIVNLGKTTIYALMKSKRFPAPLKPSERTSRWLLRDINGWIASLRTTPEPVVQQLRGH